MSRKTETTITIQLTQNGYFISAPSVSTDEEGNNHIEYGSYVFARDVHVIKFIRDLLPQLEQL